MNVDLSRHCKCVKEELESGKLSLPIVCSNKDEALMSANNLMEHMNEKYCKKHIFSVNEVDDSLIVEFDYRS